MSAELHLLLGESTIHWLSTQPIEGQASRSGADASPITRPGPDSASDMGSVATEALNTLGDQAAGKRLIAYLPAGLQTEVETTLPVHKPGPALQALPFALEDRFASSPEELHFSALQSTRSSSSESRHRIVAVAHRDMQRWIDRFRDAGLHLDQLLPSTDFLINSAAKSHLLCLNSDTLWIRSQQSPDQVIDTALLPLLLPNLARHFSSPSDSDSGNDSGNDSANRVSLYICTDAQADLRQQISEAISPERIQELSGTNPLEALLHAPQLNLRKVNRNLLTGPYQPDRALRERLRLWQPVAATAALLFMVLYIQQIMELSQLETRSLTLAQQTQDIFRAAAPHITRIVDPVTQLRQEVARRERPVSGSDRPGFLEQLSRIGPALTLRNGAPKGMKLRQIAFRNGTLELELSVPTVATLDQLQANLTQRTGSRITVLSSSSTDQQVLARLRITPITATQATAAQFGAGQLSRRQAAHTQSGV